MEREEGTLILITREILYLITAGRKKESQFSLKMCSLKGQWPFRDPSLPRTIQTELNGDKKQKGQSLVSRDVRVERGDSGELGVKRVDVIKIYCKNILRN